MSEQKSWLTSKAMQIVAEDKIRAAIADGQFDNLPGLGQPHPIFDEEYDPHWWIRRKLAREGLGGAAAIAQLFEGRMPE